MTQYAIHTRQVNANGTPLVLCTRYFSSVMDAQKEMRSIYANAKAKPDFKEAKIHNNGFIEQVTERSIDGKMTTRTCNTNLIACND